MLYYTILCYTMIYYTTCHYVAYFLVYSVCFAFVVSLLGGSIRFTLVSRLSFLVVYSF